MKYLDGIDRIKIVNLKLQKLIWKQIKLHSWKTKRVLLGALDAMNAISHTQLINSLKKLFIRFGK